MRHFFLEIQHYSHKNTRNIFLYSQKLNRHYLLDKKVHDDVIGSTSFKMTTISEWNFAQLFINLCTIHNQEKNLIKDMILRGSPNPVRRLE